MPNTQEEEEDKASQGDLEFKKKIKMFSLFKYMVCTIYLNVAMSY